MRHGKRKSGLRRHIAGGLVGAGAKEVVFHLAGQILAGARIGQVQAVFIHQHGLVAEPLGPGLLADVVENALTQLAGIGDAIQAFGFLAQLLRRA